MTRDQGRVQLVPVAMNFENQISDDATDYPDLDARLTWLERPHEFFEIFVNITNASDTIQTEWSYNTDLFDASTIKRHMAHFVQLLEAVAKDPERAIGTIPRLSADEHSAVMDRWQGKVADYPRDETLATLFAARVAAQRDATAIVDGDRTLTFAELDALANAIAARLDRRGVRPGRPGRDQP